MPDETDSEYKRVADNLFIRVKTDRYYLIVKRGGRQIRKSLKTTIRSIANAKLEAELWKIGGQKIKGKESIPTFSASWQIAVQNAQADNLQPRSVEAIESHLKIAAESFLGLMRVCDIKDADLLKYLRQRSLDASGHTANLDIQALRRYFRLAAEQGWIAIDPAASLERFTHKAAKRHIPTGDNIHKVLAYLRSSFWHTDVERDRKKAADFIEFLALSGCRIEGAQNIHWSDVSFENNYFEVTEKGGVTRRVNLFPQLKEFLLKNKKERGPIFGDYYPKKTLKAACEHLRIKRFTFHGLRHYFATEALEQGITAPIIAGWLGHKDNGILVLKTYGNHIRLKHFENEAKKLLISFKPDDAPPNTYPSQADESQRSDHP